MKRWEKTFAHQVDVTLEDVNRKATIVMEHLMQASDIFHCMQPWIVYEKWSFKLFEENYQAFKSGRAEDNPCVTWYEKELEFFDNYVIPLAMQLKDCEAFVVNNDEYLNYALKNRQQLASKGKYMVPTFLAKIESGKALANNSISPSSSNSNLPLTSPWEEKQKATNKQTQRLVDWNVEMLQRLLMTLVAKRNASGFVSDPNLPIIDLDDDKTYLDEISDTIEFPAFDETTSPDKLDSESVDLGFEIISQLRDYVTLMASKFRDNEFHGFDRGSQVCMTARKQLSRMMTSNVTRPADQTNRPADIYQLTYGISQDPLAQFAVVFAALLHDVDHPGVPNGQVVKENSESAIRFKNRSVNQQNSLDVAWTVMMLPQFTDLRVCICGNVDEMKRFRQLLVNSFLATDVIDDELVAMRKARWERAFVDGRKDNSVENRNRRATLVLELMMQSSDIFYATQNWHLYQKWNERHFAEVYKAYQNQRLTQDPCIFWYKSELIIFDEHVITVTKQMVDCGVFEASGDQQLSFALSNRQQWAAKGFNLVASMVARYHGQEIEKVRAKKVYRRMSLSAKQA
jgi:hypothetical protein